jgi:hypothetical protein
VPSPQPKLPNMPSPRQAVKDVCVLGVYAPEKGKPTDYCSICICICGLRNSPSSFASRMWDVDGGGGGMCLHVGKAILWCSLPS